MSRVIYGAIIGLALVAALEEHPPGAGAMAGTLLATALVVGLAELYSGIVGTETRTHRLGVKREEARGLVDEAVAVAFGIAFPAVFFALAAAGAMEVGTAFEVAKWSGLGLIGFYGFWAARLAGAGPLTSLLHAVAVGLLGGLLIALKALLH